MSLRAPGRSFCGAKARGAPRNELALRALLSIRAQFPPFTPCVYHFRQLPSGFLPTASLDWSKKAPLSFSSWGHGLDRSPHTAPLCDCSGSLVPPASHALAGVFGNCAFLNFFPWCPIIVSEFQKEEKDILFCCC